MQYNTKKVQVLNKYTSNKYDSFIEFSDLLNGETAILIKKHFLKRYGVQNGK